jgi:hypothetical protein
VLRRKIGIEMPTRFVWAASPVARSNFVAFYVLAIVVAQPWVLLAVTLQQVAFDVFFIAFAVIGFWLF